MRYKRRGVDKNGNVANYVETEQLIHVHNHTLSFIQTRGSVPVFWSQVGYRYNPRPRLDKSKHISHLVCKWRFLWGFLKEKSRSRKVSICSISKQQFSGLGRLRYGFPTSLLEALFNPPVLKQQQQKPQLPRWPCVLPGDGGGGRRHRTKSSPDAAVSPAVQEGSSLLSLWAAVALKLLQNS